MLATSTISRQWRKRLTGIALVILFLLAYWPIGDMLQQSLTPAGFLLWTVIGVPALQVIIFGLNAWANIQEDKQREAGSGGGSLDAAAAEAGGEA